MVFINDVIYYLSEEQVQEDEHQKHRASNNNTAFQVRKHIAIAIGIVGHRHRQIGHRDFLG